MKILYNHARYIPQVPTSLLLLSMYLLHVQLFSYTHQKTCPGNRHPITLNPHPPSDFNIAQLRQQLGRRTNPSLDNSTPFLQKRKICSQPSGSSLVVHVPQIHIKVVTHLGILHIAVIKTLHQSGVGGSRVAGPNTRRKHNVLEPVAPIQTGLVQE